MDRSFQGLVLSLIIHTILVWILLHTQAPPVVKPSERAEVTFIERERPASREKSKTFVTETEEKDPEEVFDTLKQSADFLSQYTKRVKKQLRARETGPTRNAAPSPVQRQQASKGIAGLERQRSSDDGIGLPPPGGTQAMRNVVIGSSSIAEHIPGVEEGAFTALNTDQFTYYAFFARMNEQVRNRWVLAVREYMDGLGRQDQEQLAKMDRHTVIEIILASDGEYRDAVLVSSSGDRELDKTGVQAFRAAAPFLNPPHEMVDADGKIRLKYGFMVRFRPPSFGPAVN